MLAPIEAFPKCGGALCHFRNILRAPSNPLGSRDASKQLSAFVFKNIVG